MPTLEELAVARHNAPDDAARAAIDAQIAQQTLVQPGAAPQFNMEADAAGLPQPGPEPAVVVPQPAAPKPTFDASFIEPEAPRPASDFGRSIDTKRQGGVTAPEGLPRYGEQQPLPDQESVPGGYAPEDPMARWANMFGAVRGRGGRGGGGAGVQQAAQDLAAAQAESDRVLAERTSALRAVAAEARASGMEQAEAVDGYVQQAKQISEQYEAERKAAQDDVDQRVKSYESAKQEQYKLADTQARARSLGSGVMAAIALGLGAFGANITGGPNSALQVIQTRISERADQFERDMDNARAKGADALNLVKLATDHLGDVKAGKTMALAELQDTAALQLKRFASIRAGSEAAAAATDSANALEQSAAQKRELAAQQALEAAQKRAARGGRSAMQILAEQGKMLDNALKLDKLYGGDKDGKAGGIYGKFPPNTQNRLNAMDQSAVTLKQLRERLVAYKNSGNEYIPGKEPFFQAPGERTSRAIASTLGTGHGGRGPEGYTKEQGSIVGPLKVQAGTIFLASTGRSANQLQEQEWAEQNILGNGTIDSALDNIDREMTNISETRRQLLGQHAPKLTETFVENKEAMPGQLTWRDAAQNVRDARGGGPPSPGATRAGR